jgi:hypothetical protein
MSFFVGWLKNFRHYKVSDKKIPKCMTYVVHPGLGFVALPVSKQEASRCKFLYE